MSRHDMFLFQNNQQRFSAGISGSKHQTYQNIYIKKKTQKIYTTLLMVQKLGLQHCTMSTTVFLFLQELI